MNSINRLALLLLVASLATSVSAQQPSSNERRVRQFDSEFVDAAIKKTVAPFQRLAAPDFVQISLDGYFQTKGRIIENWPWLKNANVFDRIDRVTLYDDVAIVTGEHDVKDAGSVAFTRVWQKRNDQWLAIASQHSTSIASVPEMTRGVTEGIAKGPTVMQFAEALESDAQAVFDTYRLLQESVYRGDRETLDRLTSEDCLFGRFGTFRTKRDVIARLQPRLPPELESDIRVRLNGNVAVLTVRRILETKTPPSPSGYRHQSLATVVFIRRGNAWVQASAHETLTIQR